MERDDQTATKRIVAKLITLYGDRPQLADGRQVMSNYLKEIMDAGELVAHLENELLKPLDHEARQLIMQSAVRVSILTTASPRVITEFLIILAENLRLIRKVMVVYGGRPGIGSNYRLIRHVLTNLAAAVGMEAGSEIVTDILGQGILTKISARVGEGMINGMLTIRVGFATLEYCRPCPYSGDKTSAIGQLYTALKNTFSSKNKNSEPKSGDNTQKNE